MLLYNTGNVVAAVLSLLFLVAQFAVIYIRVLPYLHTTFGLESTIYKIFLWTGFPIGCLGLDVLMFLEPFGLLAVLPLPTWLKTFVPAYKATRVICEVFIESLPQTLLQSYILVSVMGRVHTGTAYPTDIALLPSVASLPQSITISTLSTLKTWMGLVDEANKAGISIKAKAWQLWNVGGGLPLDALKKGAIDEWTCSYNLDEGESECRFTPHPEPQPSLFFLCLRSPACVEPTAHCPANHVRMKGVPQLPPVLTCIALESLPVSSQSLHSSTLSRATRAWCA